MTYNDFDAIAGLSALVTGMVGAARKTNSGRDGAIVGAIIFVMRFVIYYDDFDKIHLTLGGPPPSKIGTLMEELVIGAFLGFVCGYLGGRLWRFMNPKPNKN
jgi:hypothetical protein